ncbi:hypothetical protein SeLEV6574_g00337 [Synchytrium endobioticum]|uniref:Reverse transcriptase Ty1/copia-type domain-containing protein n=1 Tax=Synchytrium endobioticum TaxID=286115 RepID=A0A507DKF2_9FUNG|nr:hypothetical protein SeLEV6574_g00337 [Synchytrium endobioticum]
MGTQRQLGIYVGCSSIAVIKYLDVASGRLSTARFKDCMFDEDSFPHLRNQAQFTDMDWKHQLNITATPKTDYDQELADRYNARMLDLRALQQFSPVSMVSSKIKPTDNSGGHTASASLVQLPTCTAPHGSIAAPSVASPASEPPQSTPPMQPTPVGKTIENTPAPGAAEMSGIVRSAPVIETVEHAPASSAVKQPAQDRAKNAPLDAVEPTMEESSMVHVSKILDSNFSVKAMIDDVDEAAPISVDECKKPSHWKEWKQAIDAELASFSKREVFTKPMELPAGKPLVDYKWVFVRKRDSQGKVIKYKTIHT